MEKADAYQAALDELEDELTEELDETWEEWRQKAGEVEGFEVPLERTDVRLDDMILFWAPVG